MPRRLRLLLRAGLRLAAVALHLRATGVDSPRRSLGGHRSTRSPVTAGAADQSRAADWAWAVALAARLSPQRPNCLTRSLALWSLLRDEGIESRVCLGARRIHAGLLAHAWVECSGRVLNDDPDVARRFPPLRPARAADQQE